MEFNKKQIVLKDETVCILRSPKEEDAIKMIEYLKTTSEETHFMVRYPEEIEITIEEEKTYINNILNSKRNMIIGVFINDELVGSASINGVRNHIKLKHRATFGISIKKKCWNKGIGGILIKEIINEGKNMGYEQIELGVFSDNEKAIKLYEKHGFKYWGTNKNAFKLKDKTYIDEISMGMIL